MRNAAIAVLRKVGVETGGSNVQFAVDPATGRLVVIEMNPRVSRSSALASKATGFPIAKVAAKLAVGYTLDEIANDITGVTPASFEPAIDYVVTKVPRFAFEKFPGAEPLLTTSMKSVGEAMAIGRTFCESLQKALRSMETGLTGLDEIDIPGAEEERPRGHPRGARPAEARSPARDRGSPQARRYHRGGPPGVRRRSLVPARDRGDRPGRGGGPRERPAGRRARPAPAEGFGFRRPQARHPRGHRRSGGRGQACRRSASTRCSSGSTPAPPSSNRARPTCIPATRPRAATACRNARRSPVTGARSSSWAAGRIGSARASSSTIAASTRPTRSRTQASRPSWSTATRRPSPPTTTPPTGSISSRSPSRPCSTSSASSRAQANWSASTSSSAGRRRSGLPRRWRRLGCPSSVRRPMRSTWPRTGTVSGPCWETWDSDSPRTRPAPPAQRRAPSPSASATPSWSAPPTCSAGAPWRSSTTARSSIATCATPPRPSATARSCSIATSKTQIEVDVDALADGERTWPLPESWSTSRRQASTRAIRPARCLRIRWTKRPWTRSAARPLRWPARSTSAA